MNEWSKWKEILNKSPIITVGLSFLWSETRIELTAVKHPKIVHPKIKIHSLSTHHYANGALGEVYEYESQNTFVVSGANCIAAIQYNWSKWWTTLNRRKQQKKHENVSILLLRCHPSVLKPWHSYSTRNLHHVFSLNNRCDLHLNTALEEDIRGQCG